MSSEFLLTCQCGTEIPVRSTQAGGTVRCQCGLEVFVPTLRDLRQLPGASTLADDLTKRRNWQLSNGVLFAAGVPIALLCLGTFIYATYMRWPLELSKPDFREFQYERDIDTLSLSESWDAWLSFRNMQLDNRPTPPYLVSRTRAFQLLGIMTASGVGFVIGMGCILAALCMGRSEPR